MPVFVADCGLVLQETNGIGHILVMGIECSQSGMKGLFILKKLTRILLIQIFGTLTLVSLGVRDGDK